MASFPVVDFTQYQWEVLDQDYLTKWNNFQIAITAMQSQINNFGQQVETELADALTAAEEVRQNAVSETEAIRDEAVTASEIATAEAGAAAGSAAAAAISAEEAQAAAAGDVIKDGETGVNTTWSSQKINTLLTLDERTTLKSDFARDEHFVDEGTRTFAPAEYVWDVVRASPTYALGANGKYRQVPANTIARDWNPAIGQYEAQISGVVTNELRMSTSFTAPQWGRDGASLSENTFVLIEGFVTTDVEATLSSFPRLQQDSVPLGQGDRKTISLRFREKTTHLMHGTVELSGTATLRFYADIEQNRSSAVISRGDWGSVETSLEVDAQGFHVFSLTFTVPADGNYTVFFGPSSVWGSAVGVEIGASVTFAHAQLVEGTTPGPVIVTEDAPVTVAATEISQELGAEFNVNEGTLLISASGLNSDLSESFLAEIYSDVANTIRIGSYFPAIGFFGDVDVRNGGNSFLAPGLSNPITNGAIRIALIWSNRRLTGVAINGQLTFDGTSSIENPEAGQILIGSSQTFRSNGNYSDIKLSAKALTAAQLQELTQ